MLVRLVALGIFIVFALRPAGILLVFGISTLSGGCSAYWRLLRGIIVLLDTSSLVTPMVPTTQAIYIDAMHGLAAPLKAFARMSSASQTFAPVIRCACGGITYGTSLMATEVWPSGSARKRCCCLPALRGSRDPRPEYPISIPITFAPTLQPAVARQGPPRASHLCASRLPSLSWP
jgi:hypothetical protein